MYYVYLWLKHIKEIIYISDNANTDHASTSEEICGLLKDSNYDSMSAIRQDTEGVYDHTSSSQNPHRIIEDVDVYDHADPVIVKQSLQIENDGVYNQCELNIKSVIAKAHMNGDSTTIYDHAWFQTVFFLKLICMNRAG